MCATSASFVYKLVRHLLTTVTQLFVIIIVKTNSIDTRTQTERTPFQSYMSTHLNAVIYFGARACILLLGILYVLQSLIQDYYYSPTTYYLIFLIGMYIYIYIYILARYACRSLRDVWRIKQPRSGCFMLILGTSCLAALKYSF